LQENRDRSLSLVCAPSLALQQPPGITHHLRIAVADIPEANLLPCFDKCIEFIRQAIDSESAVLVHCVSAVSRSPAIVMVGDPHLHSRVLQNPVSHGC
jgi:predicted protein tyrosine phosphatase